jgi:DNA polymerase III gamma/tau subunit
LTNTTAPASPPGQAAQGVSGGGGLTREEVDRILAGKGKEVERARREAEAAQAEAKAKADELAKLQAEAKAKDDALAALQAETQSLQERERARAEAVAKEVQAATAAWTEEERAALAGLEPERALATIRLIERRSSSTAQQLMAGAVHGGQPKPPALAAPESVDYTAALAEKMAARQMGASRKSK